MFAARESNQESLGFSPFELVFGHTVRGPLKMLKEKMLLEEAAEVNLLEYVMEFRGKLLKVGEIAKRNLKSSQRCMKARYDKRSVERKFSPGEKVLALLPIPGRPLQARYFGPYEVERKVSDLNYILITPDQRKARQLCHINMVKPYFDRKSSDHGKHPIMVIVSEPKEWEDDPCEHIVSLGIPRLQNSDVLRNLDTKLSHLSLSHQQSLEVLLQRYPHLFPDVPT